MFSLPSKRLVKNTAKKKLTIINEKSTTITEVKSLTEEDNYSTYALWILFSIILG